MAILDAQLDKSTKKENLTPMEKLDFNILKDLAKECEKLKYQSIWISDHTIKGKTRFECWSTISALSTITERIRLGTSVLSYLFRNPALMAKMAATLDQISNGRLVFGIGAAYDENEHVSYGFPFPKASIRIEQLEEYLSIVKRVWLEERPTFVGKYYVIKDATCLPKPIQKPHPPIMVGGSGKKMLGLVARQANILNLDLDYPTVEAAKKKLKILETHCQAINRDFDEITKSLNLGLWVYPNDEALQEKAEVLSRIDTNHFIMGTPEECREKIEQFVEVGFTEFILRLEDLPSKTGLRLFANEILPHFQ